MYVGEEKLLRCAIATRRRGAAAVVAAPRAQ